MDSMPDPSLTAAVQQLLDIEAIKRLKASYFRLLDTQQWDRLKELFTEDLTLDIGESRSAPRTRDDFITSVSTHLSNGVTVHHGHMPEIELVDDTNARGTWAMFDLVLMRAGSGYESFTGFGHYNERYRKVDGEWKIAALQLTRLHRAVLPESLEE